MRNGSNVQATCLTCKHFVDGTIARCLHENGLTAPSFYLVCNWHETEKPKEYTAIIEMSGVGPGAVGKVLSVTSGCPKCGYAGVWIQFLNGQWTCRNCYHSWT